MNELLKNKLATVNKDEIFSAPVDGTPQDKALWMLYVVKNNLKYDGYLSAKDISEALVTQDISVGYIKISRALSRSRDLIDRKKIGKDVTFKLMKKGEQQVLKKQGKDKISVFLIKGSKPWEDRRTIADLFSKNIKGEIQIIDPYFGLPTLEILGKLNNRRVIKFLTTKIPTDTDFLNEWKRFKIQFPLIEVKVHSKPSDLHDRYMLTDNEIYLLGHGFKDFGGRESFLVVLTDDVCKEIRIALKNIFSERWKNAQQV